MGIELQKVKRSNNLVEWAEMIRACKNSGLTVKAWCMEHGVNDKTYYYRQKQVCNTLPAKLNPPVQFAQMSSPVQFAEVDQSKTSMVTEGEIRIHIGVAEIRVDSHADLALLQNVLRIVTQTC